AKYLALTYLGDDYAGVGGPNLAPPGDGPIADCVANSPGGPVHVLLTDTVAEHIPGCNMSFRKSALETVNGFDDRYRAAGDDVDLCWRVQVKVGEIGFHPAAMVWHHRRNSLRMYWRQQQGYGKAEALLEEKWPEKYNAIGHTSWTGRLYGKGLTLDLRSLHSRIYQGVWGSASFQSLYASAPTTLSALPLMPEWYLLLALLLLLSLLGTAWPPLLYVLPILLLAVLLPLAQAAFSACRARFTSDLESPRRRLQLVALTAVMHLLQPLARLIGRLRHGLTPWRTRAAKPWQLPRTVEYSRWHEQWESPNDTLKELHTAISKAGAVVTSGGDYDPWDLEVRGGLIGVARLVMGIEEHGAGRQMMRFRVWPKWSLSSVLLVVLFIVISTGSALDGAWLPSVASALLGSAIIVRGVFETGTAIGAVSSLLTGSVVRRVMG
ncbi:MAG: glycosyltransferase family 2 protein, partial [Gammaproteobacteria bacterium]